jgi:uncharacterized cupin superfamily protein
MTSDKRANPPPISALTVVAQLRKTIYPMPYATQVEGRIKRRLGDHFGLKNFGVNLTQLLPGAVSALMHSHSRQDEFIYILEGQCIARLGDREYPLGQGDCFGFPAGTGLAHQLVNRGDATVSYLEIGDRTPNERVEYPHDDLAFVEAADGTMVLVHKNGSPY